MFVCVWTHHTCTHIHGVRRFEDSSQATALPALRILGLNSGHRHWQQVSFLTQLPAASEQFSFKHLYYLFVLSLHRLLNPRSFPCSCIPQVPGMRLRFSGVARATSPVRSKSCVVQLAGSHWSPAEVTAPKGAILGGVLWDCEMLFESLCPDASVGMCFRELLHRLPSRSFEPSLILQGFCSLRIYWIDIFMGSFGQAHTIKHRKYLYYSMKYHLRKCPQMLKKNLISFAIW